MSTLNLQPPRVPMVEPKTGMITREWYRFITDSFARQGGHDAPSNTDLDVAMPEDSGVAELECFVRGVEGAFMQDPPPFPFPTSDEALIQPPQIQVLSETLESLQTEIRNCADMIAVLMKQIDDIKQGTAP